METFTCQCVPNFEYGWGSVEHFQHPMSLWIHLFHKLSIVMFNHVTNKGMWSLIFHSWYHEVRMKSLVLGEGRFFSDLDQAPHIWFILMMWHCFVPWCSFYCNLPLTYLLGVCWKPRWLLFLQGQFIFFLLSGVATGFSLIARYVLIHYTEQEGTLLSSRAPVFCYTWEGFWMLRLTEGKLIAEDRTKYLPLMGGAWVFLTGLHSVYPTYPTPSAGAFEHHRTSLPCAMTCGD